MPIIVAFLDKKQSYQTYSNGFSLFQNLQVGIGGFEQEDQKGNGVKP
jgi:hypothetical protein